MAFVPSKRRTPPPPPPRSQTRASVAILLLSLSCIRTVAAESEHLQTSHWSSDVPGFYHRLFFSGGETELRAHLRDLTAVRNALPDRGTASLRVCNGKLLVILYFLDETLISCRLETDHAEIAEFYRGLTDDFNCAEHKNAKSFVLTRNAFAQQRREEAPSTSSSLRETSRRQYESNLSTDSSSTPDDETEFSDESNKVDEVAPSDAANEPPWCSIDDPLGRQIWNETFALIVNASEQRHLIQEIEKLLQFQEQRRQCRSLQKVMRQRAPKSNLQRRHEFNDYDEDEAYEDFVEVLSEDSLKSRRTKRSLFSSIMPGTKWCGSGNFAKSFNDLGTSAKTDDCCREHDQCPYTLVSFEKRWGLRNKGFFTLSHCRCDERFRSCLKMARTSQSRFVGRMFFDLLSKQCFVFKKVRKCARLSWDGSRCIRKKWGKKAIIRDGMSYY